jgi:hypothetical protein
MAYKLLRAMPFVMEGNGLNQPFLANEQKDDGTKG